MESFGCFLRIATTVNGEERLFSAIGTYTPEGDGFRAEYREEGDRVVLTYLGGALTMERRGEVCLSACFRAGQETVLHVFSGDLCGDIPVQTSLLEEERRENERVLALEYLLSRDEAFRLSVSLKIKEAPK